MSAESAAVSNLIALGMNEREARLYLALLRKPEATPAELHRISGVPRTKTYETLERMVASGFCRERQEGRRKFFRATSPADVHAVLSAEWEQQHRIRGAMAEETFRTLDGLYQASTALDPGLDQIEVIRSKDQINHTFIGLMRSAQREVLSFSRSPYAAADDVTRAEVKQAQHEAFERDVTIRTVYMVEAKEQSWLEGFIAELEGAGERVRLAEDLPMKMFLFDRETALIALPSVPDLTGTDFTMLAVEDPGFMRACVDLFETHWDRSRPVAAYFGSGS